MPAGPGGGGFDRRTAGAVVAGQPGVYLTRGRTRAERTPSATVSPTCGPKGWIIRRRRSAGRLLEQAFLRRLSGIELKDESDNPALHGRVTPLYPQLGG